MIFVPAELIRFQPNEYDNNKLLYVWYALCCVPIAEYALELYARLKGLRARKLMAALACVVLFLSGGLSLAREVKSDYVMFSKGDAQAAQWVEENTPKDALFMSGMQHINPVAALAGRRIVCGPALWLYYHGFTLSEREADIRRFYASPETNQDALDKYGAQYILLSAHEKMSYGAQAETLDSLYKRVYADDREEIVIYHAGGTT